MPIISSTYQSPKFLLNGHWQTIFPSLWRRVTGVAYTRERIHTPDNDFLNLDWSRIGAKRLVIVSHGLEGNTNGNYVKGMVKASNQAGCDALAWNYRGCGGESNNLLRSYHSGATDDLELIVQHVLQKASYEEIYLTGFSLGGNLTLKYLGERGTALSPFIKKAVVFSVPCDLAACSEHLSKGFNKIYTWRFLYSLMQKMKQKAKQLPEFADRLQPTKPARTLQDFDDLYTAPIHGFKNALDYYDKCSSKQFIKDITIPTLIVNAENDPFLAPKAYPIKETKNHFFVHLEIPNEGGHVGFYTLKSELIWSEKRAIDFINN